MLVLIGVAGEGIDIFFKFRFKFRSAKFDRILESIGAICWIVLVVGLTMEMSEAAKSDNEVVALKERIAQTSTNTPAKMRVNSVFATATFFVETNLDNTGTYGPNRAEAFLTFSDKTNLIRSTNDLRLGMTCDEVKWIPLWSNPKTGENGAVATLYFKLDPLYGEYLSPKAFNKPAEELIKELKFFTLAPSFLYGNTTSFSHGKIILVLNGSVRKTFDIPDQKVDLNPRKDPRNRKNWAISNF